MDTECVVYFCAESLYCHYCVIKIVLCLSSFFLQSIPKCRVEADTVSKSAQIYSYFIKGKSCLLFLNLGLIFIVHHSLDRTLSGHFIRYTCTI